MMLRRHGKFQSQKVQIFGYVYRRHKWPNIMVQVSKTQLVPLARNLYGHPLGGLLWERQVPESSIGTRLGRSSQLGMLFGIGEKVLFLSVYVDARRLRCIYFIDPADEELKETKKKKKTRGGSWKFRCQQQCLAKSEEKVQGNLSQS